MAERPSSLGTRWSCFKCGAKFYDLSRPDPLCPRCGADQRERPAPPPPSSRPAKKKARRTETEDEFANVERDDSEEFDPNFSQAMSEEFSSEFDDEAEEETEEEEEP